MSLSRTKNCYLIAIIWVLITCQGRGLCAEAGQDIPEGMELRQVGQSALVVPIGAKVEEKNGMIKVEQIDRYVAREIFNLKQEIEQLRIRQQELTEQLKLLEPVSAPEPLPETFNPLRSAEPQLSVEEAEPVEGTENI